ALGVVVIDKLPFAAPDDPVFEARLDAIRRDGGNPFRDEQLPQAGIALKQGAGRLIRTEGDRGVLVLCDPRLAGRSYGRVFLDSLPRLRRTRDVARVTAFLADCDAMLEAGGGVCPSGRRRGGCGGIKGQSPPTDRSTRMTVPVSFESQALRQIPAWVTAPPPDGMDAQSSLQWWNGLAAAEQQAYLHQQPSALGGMDGLPAEVRHEANLQVLRGDAA